MRTYRQDPQAIRLGSLHWGIAPLPQGAELVGFYKDGYRNGALLRIAEKNIWCCGNGGSISIVSSPQ